MNNGKANIISDSFSSYISLANNELSHRFIGHINHKRNFVDPIDPTIHNQNIENCWELFKKRKRRMQYSKTNNNDIYLNEFLFRNEQRKKPH